MERSENVYRDALRTECLAHLTHGSPVADARFTPLPPAAYGLHAMQVAKRVSGAPHSMTPADPDPRVFFASERTLLAWIRTGLAIIGLGYVVARFGLFLRIMAREAGETATISQNPISRLIGVAFVVVGAVSVVMAAAQHRTFVKSLPAKDLPAHYYRGFALWVALSISLLGIALAAYLIAVRP